MLLIQKFPTHGLTSYVTINDLESVDLQDLTEGDKPDFKILLRYRTVANTNNIPVLVWRCNEEKVADAVYNHILVRISSDQDYVSIKQDLLAEIETSVKVSRVQKILLVAWNARDETKCLRGVKPFSNSVVFSAICSYGDASRKDPRFVRFDIVSTEKDAFRADVTIFEYEEGEEVFHLQGSSCSLEESVNAAALYLKNNPNTTEGGNSNV